MALMESPGEQALMRTLATGKSIPQGNARLAQYKHEKQSKQNKHSKQDKHHNHDKHNTHSEAGFTLIELLVTISVMAVLLGVAVLALPNHDERYWRDNLDQFVSSLNLAEEESAMSGTPMLAHIDGLGWRFSMPLSSMRMTGGNLGNNSGNNSGGNLGSTFLPDVYRAHQWHKPVEIMPVQLILGREYTTEALQVAIKQESRQALLLRSTSGRFQWVRP